MFNKVASTINRFINTMNLRHNHVMYDSKSLEINGRIIVNGGGQITLGKNIRINSGANYNMIGGDIRTILLAIPMGKIIIKDNVGLSNSSIVSKESITIDENVMIGGNCKIYDTDFHSLDYEKRMMHPDTDIHSAPVHIKKGAFIGAHSIILKGVTIGEKSIVGAGSVVTKSIPDGEIWAGNPAKYIRRVDEMKNSFGDDEGQ